MDALEDVRLLEETVGARSRALVEGDAGRMREILAEEFRYTNSRGQTIDKEAYIERFVGAEGVKWFAQEVSDLAVRVYGEAGVVTCNVHDRAEFQGNAFEGNFRSLFVYVKRNGAWRCVVGQTTERKDEG